MNDFLELAKKRYSVRNFLDQPVEEEKLLHILEAARIAPSAVNFQPWHIVVIREKEKRSELAITYNRSWFLQAPVVLIVCSDHRTSWKRADGKDHADIDIAIITDHMTLAAAELGLGTCWVCNFDAKKCREILNLPDHIEPVVYLPIGYPIRNPEEPSRHLVRKKLEEIIHWDKY